VVNHDRWQATYPLSTQYMYVALTTASVIFLRIGRRACFERILHLSYLTIQLINLDKTLTEINFLVYTNYREKYF